MLRCRCLPTWYSRVSSMLILNTLPAAKGRRNMKAKLEPLSRSFCGGEPGSTACKALTLFWRKSDGNGKHMTTVWRLATNHQQSSFINETIHFTVSPLVMSYLLQLGEGQWIAVLCSELHESHVGWMSELCDNTETGKQPGTRDTGATLEKMTNENETKYRNSLPNFRNYFGNSAMVQCRLSHFMITWW